MKVTNERIESWGVAYKFSPLNHHGSKYFTVSTAAKYLSELTGEEVKVNKLRSAIRYKRLDTELYPLTGWYIVRINTLLQWFSTTKQGDKWNCIKGNNEIWRRELRLNK